VDLRQEFVLKAKAPGANISELVPGVRRQQEDGLQVARPVRCGRGRGLGRHDSPARSEYRDQRRGRAAHPGAASCASSLGAQEAPRAASAPVPDGAGALGQDGAANPGAPRRAAAATTTAYHGGGSLDAAARCVGAERPVDGGLQGLVAHPRRQPLCPVPPVPVPVPSPFGQHRLGRHGPGCVEKPSFRAAHPSSALPSPSRRRTSSIAARTRVARAPARPSSARRPCRPSSFHRKHAA